MFQGKKKANKVHKPSKRVGSHQSIVGWVLCCGGSVHTLEATEGHWGFQREIKTQMGLSALMVPLIDWAGRDRLLVTLTLHFYKSTGTY